MARKKSIVLFGEGKADAVFLNYLRSLYADQIQARVLIDAGQGGGPKQVATRLIKKHLDLGAYARSLLLIDEDLPTDEIPNAWLRKHKITLVTSGPRCLEGILLTLLDDPPPKKDRHLSNAWKKRFCRNHLGTDRDTEILDRFKKKCPELFPQELIEAQKKEIPSLREIVDFLIT
ncbi:hypothetical protein HZ994_11615 [Akkermansiaceae bacterium]|nr:hypothetical protein HZ994_11615 [Akkermansiaceae bacterium]